MFIQRRETNLPILNNYIGPKSIWSKNDRYIQVDIETSPKVSLLRDNGILFDIVLEIPGVQQFPAHKAILAISSEYFRTLFTSRFKQSDTVILEQVEPQTVNLYLDMIYGKKVVIYDWRQRMKLLMFAKFTQSEIMGLNFTMPVSSRDFVDYVQQLSVLYDGAIPLHIIDSLKVFSSDITIKGEVFNIADINFSDLGQEFVIALIETREKEDIKYLIARKAVQEGMSTDLYKLIRSQMVNAEIFAVEAIWHLLKDDKEAVTTIGIVDPRIYYRNYSRIELVEIARRLGIFKPGETKEHIIDKIFTLARETKILDSYDKLTAGY